MLAIAADLPFDLRNESRRRGWALESGRIVSGPDRGLPPRRKESGRGSMQNYARACAGLVLGRGPCGLLLGRSISPSITALICAFRSRRVPAAGPRREDRQAPVAVRVGRRLLISPPEELPERGVAHFLRDVPELVFTLSWLLVCC